MDALPSEAPLGEGPVVAPSALPPALPAWSYFLLVGGLYTVLGSSAQLWNLPLGIWFSQLLLFVVPTLLLLRALGRRPWRFLQLDRVPAQALVGAIAGAGIALFLCASSLMAVCEEFLPGDWVKRFDLSRLLDQVHGGWRVVLFAAIVVGAPLAEEIVFRGYLQPALGERLGLRRAILVQALLFSLVHFDPVGFLPRFILGLAFGWLVALTSSLWSSVFAHALNNAISSYLYLRYGHDDGEIGGSNPWQALLLSASAGLVTLLLIGWLGGRARGRTSPRDDAAPLPSRRKVALELGLWATATALGLVGLRLVAV